MDFKLDQEDQQQITSLVLDAISKATKEIEEKRPYLNRKDASKYFGVAESTITYWASLGMPVATIEGRKLYGKQSITQWLKSKEKPTKDNTKSPQLLS